jgi:hypothetical protein
LLSLRTVVKNARQAEPVHAAVPSFIFGLFISDGIFAG